LWTQFTDTGEKKMAARLEGNIVKYVGGVAWQLEADVEGGRSGEPLSVALVYTAFTLSVLRYLCRHTLFNNKFL
jgi:hypothetical protein